MKIYKYEGKDIEEVKKKIIEESKKEESNLIIKINENTKGLFKNKKIEAEVLVVEEVINFIKEVIQEITSLMGIDINVETKKRRDNITILIHSDNNQILIGRRGKTIQALQKIIKHAVYKETQMYVNINVDVGSYKEKRLERLEKMVKQIAKDVAKTKEEIKLEPMNSYERRVVHSLLSDNKYIYTKSVGEEPERSVVIKPKEE
jgi:spoIIIJ-associated protein